MISSGGIQQCSVSSDGISGKQHLCVVGKLLGKNTSPRKHLFPVFSGSCSSPELVKDGLSSMSTPYSRRTWGRQKVHSTGREGFVVHICG